VIAAGGTLGACCRRRRCLAVYGIITEQDIGKLFIAGIIPACSRSMYMLTSRSSGSRAGLPAGGPRPRAKTVAALQGCLGDAAAVRLRDRRHLRRAVHADRSRRHGRRRRLLIGVLRRQARRPTSAARCCRRPARQPRCFTVLIGALLFGYFLTVTQTPQKVTAFLTGLGIGRYGVLALIMLMYLVLGCLMDAMAMIILTVPIIFPVITQLGFDPIWFGVIIVMTVELGLIHPPVGMNVFVIKSVVEDVKFCDDSSMGVHSIHHHRPDPARHPDCLSDHRTLAPLAL
jgi:TRAP-type C4-dicarboxylate transport system permease large subunit